VAAITALLAVPLVRSVARDQARSDLARAVDSLAAAPRVTAQALVRQRKAIGPDDRSYAVVTADGSVVGEAAGVPTSAQIDRLRSTGTLSATDRSNGEDVLVEGRSVGRRGLYVIGVQPASSVQAATDQLVRRILLALLVGLVVAVALGLLIARRVTRPVRDAAARAHRLASGERGLEQSASRVSEVQEMVAALGVLDRALAGSEARQREFLLSISHEIRTPLTALRGYAEALRDGAVPAAEVATVGATLAGESDRLNRFIDDLLALARLEADDFPITLHEVDLAELVAGAAETWAAVANRDGVTVEAVAPGPVPAVADAGRLTQVLGGLLENALRATPPGGAVTVSVTSGPSGSEITVADTGPGLAPEEYAHAFERGYLRERYAGERPVGTGLGLSIAQRVCERMGATLVAEPNLPTGTVVRLGLEPGIIHR
jgi:two-component system sensor histidine kinase BaeS